MSDNIGKVLVATGMIIALIGVIIIFKDAIPFVKHLGRLPGDIRIEKKNFVFYFPVVTGLVLSIILTIILNLIGKLK